MHSHKQTQLAIIIALIAAFSQQTWAATLLPDEKRTISPITSVESWTLGERSTLNVLPDTGTDFILGLDNSTLNMNGATLFTERAEGINLIGATANLTNTNVTSNVSYGLLVNRDGGSIGGPSSATVTGGSITGMGAGVYATYQSQVKLSGTNVNGIGDGSAEFYVGGTGLALEGATATIENGSTVTGTTYGVHLGADELGGADGANTSLSVSSSTITGTAGSALNIGSRLSDKPANATVMIADGAVLNGGNGLAITVTDTSKANVSVDNSTLNGGILVDQGAAAAVNLNNNSRLTGNVTNVADFGMSNGSSLTGDLTRSTNLDLNNNSSISGNVSQIENFTLNNGSSLTGNLTDATTVDASNG